MRRLLLLASAVVFVDTAFYAAITPLLPRYAADLELSKSAAGVLSGAYPAGTFAGALPGGWLAARAGVRPTVLLGLGTMAASSVAFASRTLPRSSTSRASCKAWAALSRGRARSAG